MIRVNEVQRERMVGKIVESMGGSVKGKTIAVLGLSFKPETDDMRDAPSLDILKALMAQGAEVQAYDPAAMEHTRKLMPEVRLMGGEYEACQGADALVIITEWNQFRMLDLERVKSCLRDPVVVDLRNIYEPSAMRAAGFRYACVGR